MTAITGSDGVQPTNRSVGVKRAGLVLAVLGAALAFAALALSINDQASSFVDDWQLSTTIALALVSVPILIFAIVLSILALRRSNRGKGRSAVVALIIAIAGWPIALALDLLAFVILQAMGIYS